MTTTTCNHPTDERYFTDDSLLEWCGQCGEVVTDHHERKFAEPHPEHFAKSKGGRPFLSTSPTVKIEVTLPASLRDKLDKLAPNGNRSAWIRQAIETA